MKYFKVLALIVLAGLSVEVSAQKSKIQTAYLEHKEGALDKAKAAIDLAVENPKTSTNAKAWYYRGLIYMDLFGSQEFSSLCEDCLRISEESFAKSEEYDSKNYYTNDLKIKRLSLAQRFEESAYMAFKENDYAKALSVFEYMLNTESFDLTGDSTTVRNASIAAKKAGNGEKVLEFNQKLLDLDYQKPYIYADMAVVHKEMGDTTKALEVLSDGLKAFPSDAGLVIEELNIFLGRGDYESAIAKLETALELEPNNHSIANALGLAYEKSGQNEKAAEAYQKAIDIKPDFFNAHYGLGALYFNMAAEKYNEAQKIPYNQTSKYNAAKKEFMAIFDKAKPYLEKALEIDPKDTDTMFSLQQLYAKTGQLEKSVEMKKMREALENE